MAATYEEWVGGMEQMVRRYVRRGLCSRELADHWLAEFRLRAPEQWRAMH